MSQALHTSSITSLTLLARGKVRDNYAVGKVAATIWAPAFPKFVLLMPADALAGLGATLLICALASTLAIRIALKVDPGEAIG